MYRLGHSEKSFPGFLLRITFGWVLSMYSSVLPDFGVSQKANAFFSHGHYWFGELKGSLIPSRLQEAGDKNDEPRGVWGVLQPFWTELSARHSAARSKTRHVSSEVRASPARLFGLSAAEAHTTPPWQDQELPEGQVY